jgi:hypothetical protein
MTHRRRSNESQVTSGVCLINVPLGDCNAHKILEATNGKCTIHTQHTGLFCLRNKKPENVERQSNKVDTRGGFRQQRHCGEQIVVVIVVVAIAAHNARARQFVTTNANGCRESGTCRVAVCWAGAVAVAVWPCSAPPLASVSTAVAITSRRRRAHALHRVHFVHAHLAKQLYADCKLHTEANC